MGNYINFNKSNCRNCYKCIRNCPVKSIKFSGNRANIIDSECVLCGECYVVCPQNAKNIVDATEYVSVLLNEGAPVIASIAPSFIAYFEKCGIESMRGALKELGFSDVRETAEGATLVKREYEKQIKDGKMDIIISSCCHSVNLLIEKYYPEAIEYLSPVVSPMIAHAKLIKSENPSAKVVFIGPCISKKEEAGGTEVDAVLTFDELAMMLDKKGITVQRGTDVTENSRARLFPVVGGIIDTMSMPKDSGYTFISVDGAEDCKAALCDVVAGNIHKCFIEMSMCKGSCINGPVILKHQNSALRRYKAVKNYAGEKDFDINPLDDIAKNHPYRGVNNRVPTEKEITEALSKMGKTKPEDELNCGSCGYNTCREKAVAVCLGKADYTMCLPHIMDQTERFSNSILDNTPNGILVINEEYEVQRVNYAALKMLHINYESDVLGEPVVNIMDPTPFFEVLENGGRVRGVTDYYAEFDKYLELSIVHDKSSHILIAIFRDVTVEHKERIQKEEMGRQTIDIADKVVEKQMRIVQEIASLLGETAAETKIALTKLKDSITNENAKK